MSAIIKKQNLVKPNKEIKEKNKKLLITGASISLAIILLITGIYIFANQQKAEDKPEYTGAYNATVYVKDKLSKDKSNNSVLLLNYDGSGSLVIDGELIAEKWRPTRDGIKIGSKKMIHQKQSFIYEDKGKDMRIVFEQDIPEPESDNK